MKKLISMLVVSLFVFALLASAPAFAAGSKDEPKAGTAVSTSQNSGQPNPVVTTSSESQRTGQYQQRDKEVGDRNCEGGRFKTLPSAFGGAGVP